MDISETSNSSCVRFRWKRLPGSSVMQSSSMPCGFTIPSFSGCTRGLSEKPIVSLSAMIHLPLAESRAEPRAGPRQSSRETPAGPSLEPHLAHLLRRDRESCTTEADNWRESSRTELLAVCWLHDPANGRRILSPQRPRAALGEELVVRVGRQCRGVVGGARSAVWTSRSSPQRGTTIEVAGVHFCFVPIRIEDEQRPAFQWLLPLDRPTRSILRGGERLDDFIEGVLSDRQGKMHRPAALMTSGG